MVSSRDCIFTNNIIIGNTSSGEVGGVYFLGTVTFINNNIIGNIGSGIVGKEAGYDGPGFVTLISNNVSANSEEGINIPYIALTATNNTIALNGGIGLFASPGRKAITNIYNNIIWGNKAGGDESDVYMAGYGAESNFYNNLYTSAFAIWDNEGGNLIVDPLFHDPENGDFHVSSGSPALNAGLNTAPEISDTDLDGNPRIIDGIVDIGAYERSTTALHPADLNGNWVIELTEFNSYNDAWRANTDWANEPNPVPMDYVTRAGYLLQKGGGYQNIGVGKPATWVPSN